MEYNRPERSQGSHHLGILGLQAVLERVFRDHDVIQSPHPHFVQRCCNDSERLAAQKFVKRYTWPPIPSLCNWKLTIQDA